MKNSDTGVIAVGRKGLPALGVYGRDGIPCRPPTVTPGTDTANEKIAGRTAQSAVPTVRFLSRATLITLIAGVCAAAQMSTARSANEAALLELWTQHLASPDDHEAVLKSCGSFIAANPVDPLIPVVQGIESWHEFRASRTAEGVKLIEPYLTAPPGPVTDSARLLALGWMTRMDREKVAAALQFTTGRRSRFRKHSRKSPVIQKYPRTRALRSMIGLANPGFINSSDLASWLDSPTKSIRCKAPRSAISRNLRRRCKSPMGRGFPPFRKR